MSKPNYELKAQLINSPIMADYKLIKKNCSMFINGIVGCSEEAYIQALELQAYHEREHSEEFKECCRIENARYKKSVRVKKAIEDIVLNSDCLFLTLTFRDKYLYNSTMENRRKAVRDFLNSFNCPYVANIDFGTKHEREHYHAVLSIERIDYSLWLYGAINGVKIRNGTDDLTRISKYIAKLTNHAIKETTKNFHILYSRGTNK